MILLTIKMLFDNERIAASLMFGLFERFKSKDFKLARVSKYFEKFCAPFYDNSLESKLSLSSFN